MNEELKEIYIQLYCLMVHITDHGKIEGGTPQSAKLIEQVKRLGQLGGIKFEDVKDEIKRNMR